MMIGLVLFAVYRVNYISDNLATINDINSVKRRYAINFRGSVHDRAISARDLILVSDPSEFDNAVSEIRDLERFYETSAVALDNMLADVDVVDQDEARILESIKETERLTNPLVNDIIQIGQNGQVEEAREVLMGRLARCLSSGWRRLTSLSTIKRRKTRSSAIKHVKQRTNFKISCFHSAD